jgi:cellulose synthase operon protein C
LKSSHKLLAFAVLIATAVSHAELAQWVQHIPGGSALEAVFFRTVPMPAGPVLSRKPPRETVVELTRQIAAAPSRADLISLRAHEAELNLDFTTAEQDWKTFARMSADSVALADYYHRRLQPKEELAALLDAANQPATGRDALNSDREQRSWRLFTRAVALVNAQAMPVEARESVYDAWIARYPKQPHPYTEFFQYLIVAQRREQAEQAIARYRAAFPNDEAFPLQARAQLMAPEDALKLYESGFRPVLPPNVVAQYFQLLKDTRNLRTFLAKARAEAAAHPNDLNAAAKLFYYYQQQGNLAQAHRALLEYRMRRGQPTAAELLAVATLFEQTNNYAEAARSYQDLSRVQGAEAEEGYAGLIRILFTVPEQQLPLGGGDISFYKDIATMDPYPGTLNGILSLLFNSTDPRFRYSEQERAAVPYFHRAKAAELLQEMEKRFPKSQQLSNLQSMLLQAYARHGENEEVIKRGRQFLSANPSSSARTAVWLLIADAHARRDQTQQEFAVYDALLQELAASTNNVPLGSAGEEIPDPGAARQPRTVRSPQYVEVLDRYINRLVSLKRANDALALYRREIDRNPNDPGLYERLAEFLNQNKLAAEIEQVYTKATQQFQDRSWHHKLARWYLRQKQEAAFEDLTKAVAQTFSGTELDSYFQQVVANANLDATLYRQVNLYAYQRFPHDLVFVKNLLNAYQRRGTADPNAYMALLRQNWYHDNDLRSRFFERLSSEGKLDAEIAALRSMTATTLADRAATELIAGAEVWRSHFENAAPVMQMLAASYPAHHELNTTASSLFRSLGQAETAARISERLSRSDPRDRNALASIGEIYAGREQFDKARAYWNRIADIEPGNAEGYSEAATVLWDYYQYDDALRVIEEGRAKLRNPTAFAYEAGAIFENKRAYTKAIAEYLKGAQADPDSPARRRLVKLASRPAHRDAIEAQTRSLATGANLSITGWNLRIALLEEQNRRDDVASLLTATASSTSNFDLLARVEQVAERNGLPRIREQAVTRQAILTADPVERTRLRLMLARLAEDRKDAKAAQQTIEAAYKENPNIAGVVRATVDYHWRSGDRKRAIDTLEEAAARSNASFKRQFTLEAARKSTEAADYARARRLLEPLLVAEPLASDLVAAAADTYGRAGDDSGLREFYSDRLKLAKTPDQQAALRRGLIPVLTRMKEYGAAVDEYIAILSKFPEDETLVSEAARFARKYGMTDRLTGFYLKAVADSPKDARWPTILARAQTALENLPAAIDGYTKALAIRPDRSDLLASRAALEERLLRFEDAAKSYTKLYDLAYKDPQFMVKVAETRARLGQKDAAIQALRTAFLEGKSAKADAYFEIASKLEQWNWLAEAKHYADDGRNLDPKSGVDLHARIAARLRDYTALDDEQAIEAAAKIVNEFYTPEEKTTFGAWLMNRQITEKPRLALMAGLQDVAVRNLTARISANPKLALGGEGQELIQIQQERLQYAELAEQLEVYWNALAASDQRDQLLIQAADNWRLAANPKEELRVRQLLFQRGNIPDPTRYADLLYRAAPDRFIQAAAGTSGLRDAAMALAYKAPDSTTALKIIDTRGAKLPPVWSRAYTALTGVYFNQREPAILNAFTSVLGPRTIGEQVAARADRNQQVVGDTWFYYGSRYGEFTNSEDFLSSEVEGRPASANSYMALGDYYSDAKSSTRAMEEYGRALQLDPKSAGVHNRIANVYASQKKMAEAQAHWRQALSLWSEMQDGRVPENFWTGVAETIERAGPALRPEIDKLLRTYIRRNGTYRFDPLLNAIWKIAPNATEAARWIADLSSAAAEPAQFLASIVNEPIVEPAQREVLYARLLDLAQRDADRRAGDARNDARWRLQDYQLRYLRSLLASKQYTKAAASIRNIPSDLREAMHGSIVPIEIEIAATTGGLDSILSREDVSTGQLRQAATSLRQAGDPAAARRVLEALYTRELDHNNLDASNFLGLAEVKLESNDTAAAVDLLRRMTLVAGEPFETLNSAAELLARFNRINEAVEFWDKRVKAAPWDFDAAVHLANAKNDTATLRTIAIDNQAPYSSRTQAAKALAKVGATGLGSAELDALASSTVIDPDKPYFYEARLKAAMQTNDPALRIRLLRGAIAVNPTPPTPRVQLFQAYFQAGQFEQAIAVFREQIPQEEAFLRNIEERASLARDLAAAHRKLGNLEQARRYLLMLARIDPKQNVKPEIVSLDAELRRIEENQRRMPHVHDNADQTEKVRPRI